MLLLCIAKESREAGINLVLLMAMEEGVAEIVGDKVGFYFGSRFNNYHIFANAAQRGFCPLFHFTP